MASDDRSGGTLPLLVCAGYLNVDIVAYVPDLPGVDERVTALEVQRTLGGIATNVACAAAMLGSPWGLNVELIATVGDDPESEWAEAEVRRRGVSTEWLIRRPGTRAPFCLILVEPNGQRAIVSEPVKFDDSQVSSRLVQPAMSSVPHLLYVDGYRVPTSLPYIQHAADLGWLTAVDLDGLPSDWRTPTRLLEVASQFNVVFMNRATADAVWPQSMNQGKGEALPDIIERTLKAALPQTLGFPHAIILTLGEEGAWVILKDEVPVHVPAIPVKPVDTTGAGDVFAGVLLAVWLNGEKILAAARLASIAAGLSTTARGAQGFLPTARDILEAQAH